MKKHPSDPTPLVVLQKACSIPPLGFEKFTVAVFWKLSSVWRTLFVPFV
jgi:hypothetical protein